MGIDFTRLAISVLNLISLILGGISLALVFKLGKRSSVPYLSSLTLFLFFGLISGFFDWIAYNWVYLLIPDLSSASLDRVYHIFWDLIGYPAAFLTLFFLFATICQMLNINFNRIRKILVLFFIAVVSSLSYISFYFRIQETNNWLSRYVWALFFEVLPFIQLTFLAYAYYRCTKLKSCEKWMSNFILILFFCYTIWHLLSQSPIDLGAWKLMIILPYFMILFLPTVYLYKNLQLKIPEGSESNNFGTKSIFNNNELNFTERENELILLLLEGKSNQEISEELFVSLQTVKNYVSKIYKKAGIKNRVELVNLVREYPKNH